MTVTISCLECESPVHADSSAAASWTCPKCSMVIRPATGAWAEGRLKACAACGNGQLYRKKDFPQWLGMALLAGACGLFFIFAIRYQYSVAWAILLGSAAVDGLIYLVVGDVVVCYRCGAAHRGVNSRAFDPFELTVAERYRQERLRREQRQ